MTRVTGTPRKRYSHNGCKECKRRKIKVREFNFFNLQTKRRLTNVKCDEGKPVCWHCDRLEKSCRYLEGKGDEYGIRKVTQLAKAGSIQTASYGEENYIGGTSASPIVFRSNNGPREVEPDQLHDSFTAYWAPLLANDLSDLVNSILSEMTAIEEPESPCYSIPNGVTPESCTPVKQVMFQTNVPFSYLNLTGENHFYMKEFYNEFSNVILPFQASSDGIMINPVRDILIIYARESHYLLYALLACGARSSHRKSSLPEDQSSYKLYLRRCLETLTAVMERDMMGSLDSILLTILVLTCDSASHTRQEWRAHLRGAKDLLSKNDTQKTHSMIFLLCKSWYSSIEILAGLVSPKGGTLRTGEELDLLICNRSEEVTTLRKLNIVSEEGFSLFHGYSMELVVIIKDLIKILRREGKSQQDYCAITELISSVRKQLDFELIDKSGIVPNTHPCYPKKINENDSSFSNNISVTYVDGRKLTLSWSDISHRSYALAALLTIFTKLLNIDKGNAFVQSMVKDLISTACCYDGAGGFLKSHCYFVLQWPMLVAGTNSIIEEHKARVETFFRLVAQLGSGSAGFALARLRRIWSNGPAAENETAVGIDMVTY